MINDRILQVPNGVEWLGKFLTELPENCIFDKSLTGCGGTTIALTCPSNYVICVPFISLIQNKQEQHSNILGIYKGISVKQIKSYLTDSSIEHKKIMVTYDSLYKLENYINISEYKLLVDEYHLLFNQYSFRHRAVKNILNLYTKFKNYCFMTATLLEREFILSELQHVPIVTAKWDTIQEVTVNSLRCEDNVIHTVAHLINEYLSEEKKGNAYFFVNSVEFIKTIVATCNLNNSNTRAIWSANNKTQTGLNRGKIINDTKKINLLTSTVFEGCDFKDEDGHIYIVSDGNKKHTIVDISTSFQQIAGRIRDSRHRNIITHIYNQTRYSVNISYEEYKLKSDLEVEKNKNIAYKFTQLDKDLKEKWVDMQTQLEKESNYNSYLRIDNGNLVFDENMAKIDLYNFKVTKSIYKIRINLSDEYRKNGYIVNEEDSVYEKVTIINTKLNFKGTVLEMQKGDSDFILQAYKKYPFLHEAIVKIGFKGIEDSNYNITTIKRKLIVISYSSDKQKIYQCLKTVGKVYEGSFIENSVIKKIFEDIYKQLNMKDKPKPNDINNYFHTKPTVKKVKRKIVEEINSKKVETIKWESVKGYVLIKSKL